MNKATGIKRILAATGYSWRGLATAWHLEAAFRQEVILFFLLAPLGWWLAAGQLGFFVLLMACPLLVVIVELLNSAIEALTDRVGTEFHTLSGQAKDMASAAVMLSLLLTAMVWGAKLIERLA